LAKNRSGRLPPFVAMTWKLLNSEVYKGLSHPAAKLLPYFLGKPKRPLTDPEYYTLEFKFSYPEGKKLGFAKSTFAKCIAELRSAGLIRKTRHGGLKGTGKGYNWFMLSRQWETDRPEMILERIREETKKKIKTRGYGNI
jgi:hypothetical protein